MNKTLLLAGVAVVAIGAYMVMQNQNDSNMPTWNVENTTGGLASGLTDGMSNISNAATNMMDGASEMATNTMDSANNMTEDAMDMAKDATSKATDMANDAMNNASEMAKNAANMDDANSIEPAAGHTDAIKKAKDDMMNKAEDAAKKLF